MPPYYSGPYQSPEFHHAQSQYDASPRQQTSTHPQNPVDVSSYHSQPYFDPQGAQYPQQQMNFPSRYAPSTDYQHQQLPPHQFQQIQEEHQPVYRSQGQRSHHHVQHLTQQQLEQQQLHKQYQLQQIQVEQQIFQQLQQQQAARQQYQDLYASQHDEFGQQPNYPSHVTAQAIDPSQVASPPRYSQPSLQQHLPHSGISHQQYHHIPPQQSQVSIRPPSMPQHPVQQMQQQRVLQGVEANMTRQQPLQKPVPKPEPEVPEPDYPALLLTLADEYLTTANKLEGRTEEYYKLSATAMACIESTLKNFNLVPLREAQLSLKYAQLLYDETTNYDDAESILTKAIDLCNRMKFYDLKYAMQLLLTKVLYKSKPKAAIRDLNELIEDLEAYHHVAWEYAFRFQHVVFSMEVASSTELHAAVSHLEKIQHAARQNGDHAVFAFAAIIEALLHLQSTSVEGISQSQSALAKARSLQLNPDVENTPQMPVMIEFINLACSTKAHDYNQIEEKRRILQDVLYNSFKTGRWDKSGRIFLPISNKALRNLSIQEGSLIHEEKGKHYLVFEWMGKDEAEAVGYLLSGASVAYKNVDERVKKEAYMVEGRKIPKEMLLNSTSISSKETGLQSRWRILTIHFRLEAGLLQCARGDWSAAQKVVKDIKTLLEEHDEDLPIELEAMFEYLKGCIQHGTGYLDEALKIFQSPLLTLQQHPSTTVPAGKSHHTHTNDLVKQISMLAAMNTALIIHSPTHPRHHLLQNLINNLDTLINEQDEKSQNKHIKASYSFLLAVMPNSTILRTKQYLSQALDTAKRIWNNQIVGLTLTVMQEKFFKGVVPDTQAMKCAQAATHSIKTRWGDPMWTAVASQLQAECVGMLGNIGESQALSLDAEQAMEKVPEKVKKVLTDQ